MSIDRRGEVHIPLIIPASAVRPQHTIKRVLFVEPQSGYSTGFNDTVRVEPLGPEYLAGSLQRGGIESKLLDLRTRRGQQEGLESTINRYQPEAVLIKAGYTTDVPVVAELAAQVKGMDRQMPVIVGGHHISLSPQDLYTPHIDGIAYGQAEDTLPQALRALGSGRSLGEVPYMYYRDQDGSFKTTHVQQPVVNDIIHDSSEMNTRPLPLRELSDPYRDEYHFLYRERPYTLESSRGCRYRCSFCSVWQFNHGEYKVEGWERTFDEIQRLPEQAYVNIIDDLAIQVMPHEDYRESGPWKLAQALIQSGNKRKFWMQCRADNIVRNPELYDAWAEAGLDMVLIGLESDDPAELKRVNKGSRVNVNEQAIDQLHERKVKVWGAQIIFADWNEERFDHLTEYNQKHLMETPQFTIHTPLPGTVDWGKYRDQLVTEERQYFDFLHPTLPTRLPIEKFIERYTRLYRECHMSGEELAKMVRSGEISERAARDFARQYVRIVTPKTYQSAINLHNRPEVLEMRRQAYPDEAN